jgi:flagellar basal-body rod protein FlgB
MKADALDPTISLLRDVLGRTSQRAQAVASNLANLDTPGYRTLDVDFADLVGDAGGLYRTQDGHLAAAAAAPARGTVVELPTGRLRADGNNVDVDREMTLLAQLQGRYRASTELVRKRYALLIYAITEGRTGA